MESSRYAKRFVSASLIYKRLFKFATKVGYSIYTERWETCLDIRELYNKAVERSPVEELHSSSQKVYIHSRFGESQKFNAYNITYKIILMLLFSV